MALAVGQVSGGRGNLARGLLERQVHRFLESQLLGVVVVGRAM